MSDGYIKSTSDGAGVIALFSFWVGQRYIYPFALCIQLLEITGSAVSVFNLSRSVTSPSPSSRKIAFKICISANNPHRNLSPIFSHHFVISFTPAILSPSLSYLHLASGHPLQPSISPIPDIAIASVGITIAILPDTLIRPAAWDSAGAAAIAC